MPKPRNSDGTLRRTNRPGLLTNRSVIAHWVESEALRVKQLGMSYQAIAEHIKEVAEGRRAPMVPIPDGLVFPPAYRITTQAVHRAFQRAIVRLPNGEAAEFRKLDSERLDSMLLSLQPGIRKGDPGSIEVAIKILAHKAELNGYKLPTRVEMASTQLADETPAESAAARNNANHIPESENGRSDR